MGNTILGGGDDTQQQQSQAQAHTHASNESTSNNSSNNDNNGNNVNKNDVHKEKERKLAEQHGNQTNNAEKGGTITHGPADIDSKAYMSGDDGEGKKEYSIDFIEDEELARLFDTNLVPCTFKWEGGGREVYLAGSFNNWAEKIQMNRSGNDFTYTIELPKGQYLYKFVVDDEWRFAPDQPTIADTHGHINNFLDISSFEATFENMRPLDSKDHILSNDLYGNFIPEEDDYAQEPPPLPPHLRQIILNHKRPEDPPSSLQNPLHVNLDHLYCTAVRDGLMVLGSSQRYRRKFVTTVFYTPVQGSKPIVSASSIAKNTSKLSAQSSSKRATAGNTFPESTSSSSQNAPA